MFLGKEKKIIKEMSEVFTVFKFNVDPVLRSLIPGIPSEKEYYYNGLYYSANVFDDIFCDHEVELYFKLKVNKRSQKPIKFSNFADNIAANIIERNIEPDTHFMAFSNQSNDTGYIVNIHNLLSSCNIIYNLISKDNSTNTKSYEAGICTNIVCFENEYFEGYIKYLTPAKKHKATIFERYMHIMFKK